MKTAFLVFVSFMMMNCACRTPQKTETAQQVMIYLANELGQDYLQANYARHGFVEATLSSRSENKWRADFLCSKKEMREVLAKMKNDSNVISSEMINDKIDKPSNSTNTGSSKTKPIKNQ
ncbi:MAG: hypothetical protein SH856_15320 [Flavobacteriales bacterium]|nr:hypothetical protein [Flavobacteriales bacterium]